jgi:hypothetical protein
VTRSRTAGVSRATLLSLAFVLVLIALLLALVAGSSGTPPTGSAIVAGMPQADALDDRWGTYVSEREWGNPR